MGVSPSPAARPPDPHRRCRACHGCRGRGARFDSGGVASARSGDPHSDRRRHLCGDVLAAERARHSRPRSSGTEGALVSAVALAIVTNGSVGGKTVRTRWENDLADYSPTLHHIEDHARWASRLTENHAKSVGLALSGRATAREAIRSGANIVLLSTLQNAPF